MGELPLLLVCRLQHVEQPSNFRHETITLVSFVVVGIVTCRDANFQRVIAMMRVISGDHINSFFSPTRNNHYRWFNGPALGTK
jgi:hypothetical protein